MIGLSSQNCSRNSQLLCMNSDTKSGLTSFSAGLLSACFATTIRDFPREERDSHWNCCQRVVREPATLDGPAREGHGNAPGHVDGASRPASLAEIAQVPLHLVHREVGQAGHPGGLEKLVEQALHLADVLPSAPCLRQVRDVDVQVGCERLLVLGREAVVARIHDAPAAPVASPRPRHTHWRRGVAVASATAADGDRAIGKGPVELASDLEVRLEVGEDLGV